MIKAKKIIKYKGKYGKITLDEVHTDLEAFLELDDSVLDRVSLRYIYWVVRKITGF
jgi:hypothetical protein